MKSKILALVLLAIAISVVLSLGYETTYKSSGLEIKNLRISTYSGNNTRLSYVGIDRTLSAIKGYLFTWYTEEPSEVLDQYQNDGSKGYVSVYGNLVSAEAFKVGVSGYLTKISLYISKYGSPPDLTIEIRGVTTDSNGNYIPNSTVYISESVPSSSIPTTDSWVDITFSNPIQVSAGERYTIVLSSSGDSSNKYEWRISGSDVYSEGCRVTSFDGGSSWATYSSYDFAFRTYISNEESVSSFQISFDYSINSRYTVAYKSDLGREINTFNYTINIYHNVDTNQSWILAYSISFYNVTSFSDSLYTSPWISMLSGSYSQDYHNYYWKIEVVVDAYDSITGSILTKSSYLVLTDQFYWQSYADFNGLAELVDTNMNVETIIQPYSLILVMIVVITFFIINKRMMERD